jgi:hypothetical protein
LKLVLLSIPLITLAVGNLMAADIHFTFAPDDSMIVHESIFTEHIRTADGVQGLVDSTKAYYHRQFVASPVGFDLISIPDSVISSRDGKPLDNPISDAVARTTLRLILDDDGHCMSIEGLDQLEKNLIIDDTSLAATMRKNLNPRGMGMKEAGEWNAIIDPLVNVKLELGDLMYAEEEFQVGAAASLKLYTITECVDTFRVGGALCARIFMHSDSDFLRLAQRRNKSTDDLLKDFGYDKKPSVPTQASVMRVLQMVMDVSTMNRLGVLSKTEMMMEGQDKDRTKHEVRLLETKDDQIFYDQKY